MLRKIYNDIKYLFSLTYYPALSGIRPLISRLMLFKIGLHGSEMVLARDFEGFGLFGANVFFGAFNTGMSEQELGRAKVAGLLIDVSWERSAAANAARKGWDRGGPSPAKT